MYMLPSCSVGRGTETLLRINKHHKRVYMISIEIRNRFPGFFYRDRAPLLSRSNLVIPFNLLHAG